MRTGPWLLRLGRCFSLLVVCSLGVVVLMRAAPGYFDDEREMTAEHANEIRKQLNERRQQSAVGFLTAETVGLLHGDLGISRQYGAPVGPLLIPRLQTTARIVLPGVFFGSLVALCIALLVTIPRKNTAYLGLNGAAAMVCAAPVSVLALWCMLSGFGNAASVLFLLVLVRDVRFISRLLRRHAAAPHLLFARAAGISTRRLLLWHLLWPVRREIAALMLTSFLVGLNATLPLEVLFGIPGVGQLAWSAAMNRDLPVLLAVSFLLALCVGLAGLLQAPQRTGAAT